MGNLSEIEEFIPEYAYAWRPYVNSKVIYIEGKGGAGDATMVIDPWNQRWIITTPAAVAFIKLADGKTRLAQILRELYANKDITPPAGGYLALVDELVKNGMLFNCRDSHRESGRPVYNLSQVTGLHLEVTNACNMTCQHCYVSSGKKLPNELSLENIKEAIDMLPPFTGKRIALSGGEPAARKDLDQIIDYCVGCGHDVDVYTNGKKFPRRLAEQIRALNGGSRSVRIQVSLEGATRELNDEVRGHKSFDYAIESLTMFKEMGLGPHVVIFVCLTSKNIHQLREIVELAEQVEAGMLVFSQWQKQGNAANLPWASIAPSRDQWVQAGDFILGYRNPKLKVYGNFFGDISNDPVTRYNFEAPLFPKHTYFYNAFPRISATGDVWADQMWVDPEWVLGNVKETSIDTCMESPKLLEQLNQMRRRELPECEQCTWKSLCEGGSPGHTFAEYDGDMNHRDLFCGARVVWFERFAEHHFRKALGDNVSVAFARPPDQAPRQVPSTQVIRMIPVTEMQGVAAGE
ncbi:radical SAM/SPASM domain-containing protein [Massilia genomosp. 1]|uniref:Radical SAM protein n=1 Tax=Massilia genomosp. 1 TaxID=2609280 RepID=A0ABX0MF00_9BURK|nr:radical SAM protein [Massilia genomosp. 1]NHZ61382.1 radical SAM protein [Massilia genomosp. 1]